MGFNAPVFQYGQNIPINPKDDFAFPDEQIIATGTDAMVFLTLYPRPNPWSIPESDIEALVSQFTRLIVNENRKCFIRFAPEMNGNWNYWGQEPTKFLALWKRLHDALSKLPVAWVWAPSFGKGNILLRTIYNVLISIGYPYPNVNKPFPKPGTSDFILMDTNKNGQIDIGDDPYDPYYPGHEYVDWVGLSVYDYGPGEWPWQRNGVAQSRIIEDSVDAFYKKYVDGAKKPMMVNIFQNYNHYNTNVDR